MQKAPSNWYILLAAVASTIVQWYFGIIPAFATGIIILMLAFDPPKIPKILNFTQPIPMNGS
jgi:hypothetical protein